MALRHRLLPQAPQGDAVVELERSPRRQERSPYGYLLGRQRVTMTYDAPNAQTIVSTSGIQTNSLPLPVCRMERRHPVTGHNARGAPLSPYYCPTPSVCPRSPERKRSSLGRVIINLPATRRIATLDPRRPGGCLNACLASRSGSAPNQRTTVTCSSPRPLRSRRALAGHPVHAAVSVERLSLSDLVPRRCSFRVGPVRMHEYVT